MYNLKAKKISTISEVIKNHKLQTTHEELQTIVNDTLKNYEEKLQELFQEMHAEIANELMILENDGELFSDDMQTVNDFCNEKQEIASDILYEIVVPKLFD
jgi:hypothetical protein